MRNSRYRYSESSAAINSIPLARSGPFQFSPTITRWIAAALALIAIVFCLIGKRGLDHAEATKSWPSTKGYVTQVMKYKHVDRETQRVHYTYVSTVEYFIDDDKYSFKVGKKFSKPVEVYYDASDPSDSVIQPGIESDGTDLAFLIAIFFGFLAAAVLAVSMSPRD